MTEPSAIEIVLFDLDGVLVDSRTPIAGSMNFALEQLGLAREPAERLQRWIGYSLREAFESLLEARGADRSLAEACVAHYRERYRTLSLEQTRLVPGMDLAVRTLAAQRVLAVATSKPEAFARPILDQLGLTAAFAGIAGPPLAETHRENKTRTVERALASLGARDGRRPRAAALVGDRHLDVQAGRRLGLLTVGVTWGIGDAAELRGAGARFVVETPAQLVALFEGAGPAGGP